MMEQLKDNIIGLVLKINRWSQTQTPRRSDDDYDDDRIHVIVNRCRVLAF